MLNKLSATILHYRPLVQIVGLLVLLFFGYQLLSTQQNLLKTIYEVEEVNVQATADIIEDHVRMFLIEHKMVLCSISKDPHIAEMLQGTKKLCEVGHTDYFDSIQEAHKEEISAFSLLDDKGLVLHRSPFWPDGKDRRMVPHLDKPGVKKAIETRSFRFSEIFENNLGKKAFSMVQPVYNKDTLAGLARFMVELDHFKKSIDRLRGTHEVFLLDKTGNILLATEKACTKTHATVRMKKEEDELYCLCDDKEVIVWEAPLTLDNISWKIVVEGDINQKIEAYGRTVNRNIAAFVLTCLVIFIGLFISNRIISRQQQLEIHNAYLRDKERSEKIMRAVFEATPGLLSVITPDRKVVYSNWKLYPHSEETPLLRGKPCFSALKNHPAACNSCKIDEVLETKGIRSFEEKDEMTGRRFAVSMFPVTLPHGETDLVAEYALDITERKQHEEFKEEVGRIIRHDLKAPLASMISGIHMLSSDDLEPDTRKRLLETLDQTAAITIRTADSSLDIFKMKEGIFVVPDETFSVFDMINHLKQQFRYFLEYKNVRLDLMYENILEQKGPDDFQGKRHNIEALLANLIQNAYEAAPNESVVSLVIKKRDKAILFEVHNESEIHPEARKNLFKQYATYGKKGGTGLGLYSAMLTANAYGGDIEAKSSSSEGTTFTAILPWTQESTS